MRLNFNKAINIIKHLREYIFPVKKLTDKFKTLNTIQQLETFIEEKSAHVVQTTLYGYIKTRMGFKHTIMFEDEKFLESIDIAKWNIYVVAVADCTFYSFSYLMSKRGLKKNDSRDVFLSVLARQKSKGLSSKIYNDGKVSFENRFGKVNWQTYFEDDPFINSGNALYKWSPIADNLKELDKEIVLNSIKYKWNSVKAEFEKITANSHFDI